MFSCYFRLLNVSFHLTFTILIPILQIVHQVTLPSCSWTNPTTWMSQLSLMN